MLDILHLPKQQKGSLDYFWGKSARNGQNWELWEKPRGCNMILISAIGGGSGGGGGASNNSTTARGGGAGGSSGAFTQVIIPAIHVPDTLYVSAGSGGFGGLAGNPAGLGGFGIGSFVAVQPFAPVTITTTSVTTAATATSTVNHGFTTGDSVVITGATPGQYNGTYTITVTSATTFTYTITSTTPTASSPGTGTITATKINQITSLCYAAGGPTALIQASSTATSTVPAAAAAAEIANMPLAGLGHFKALAGQAGSAGGAFANGVSATITYPTTGLLLSGGGGGGGGSSASATTNAITAPTQAQERFIGNIGVSAAGNPAIAGKDGMSVLNAPFSSIGAGGGGAGSVNNAVGGNGANGGFGSGGSGGGGGATGGNGGNGGQGVVIIQSW